MNIAISQNQIRHILFENRLTGGKIKNEINYFKNLFLFSLQLNRIFNIK